MILPVFAIFRSPIREDTHAFQVMPLEKRNNPIVEHIGGDKSILSVIQLCKPDFGVGVDDSLLINMSDAFGMLHIISVLGNKKTRIIGLYFSMSLLLLFSFYAKLSD